MPYAREQPGIAVPAESNLPVFAGAAPAARQALPQGSPAFPSHFAPPAHAAPPPVASSVRSGPQAHAGLAPAANRLPAAPTEPGSVMAASVFLGLPLALAILIVAVLSLR